MATLIVPIPFTQSAVVVQLSADNSKQITQLRHRTNLARFEELVNGAVAVGIEGAFDILDQEEKLT